MAIIYFDDAVVRQTADGREIVFTWPRSGETITYSVSIDGGETWTAGVQVITENPPDGDVAEYSIPYSALDRPAYTGLAIYDLTDGTDSAKIYVNILAGPLSDGERFTSLEEIQRVFSVEGVGNHVEDFEDEQFALVINELITRATETVLQFLRGRYVVSSMADSYWVRMKATWIACYYLSVRQGNPSLYGDQYQEALLDLALARDGVINPGLNTPMRVISQTPMIDSRYFHAQRIDPSRSTKVYSNQRLPYRLASYE